MPVNGTAGEKIEVKLEVPPGVAVPVTTLSALLSCVVCLVHPVGADAYTTGAKTIGSVLVDRMQVAGS